MFQSMVRRLIATLLLVASLLVAGALMPAEHDMATGRTSAQHSTARAAQEARLQLRPAVAVATREVVLRAETLAGTREVRPSLAGDVAGRLLAISGVATETGGAASVRLGQAGETGVRGTYNIGDKATAVINGNTRIFEGLNAEAVSEVKNVASQAFSSGLINLRFIP